MLQVHVTNASLWIAAAKYEIEEMGSAENARNLLQEAIRLNPKSKELFREASDMLIYYGHSNNLRVKGDHSVRVNTICCDLNMSCAAMYLLIFNSEQIFNSLLQKLCHPLDS